MEQEKKLNHPITEKNPLGAGRPKNARNKSSIIKAQLAFDNAAELAANTLIALMKNDKAFLGIDTDVPATIILQACKTVIDKVLANEREKEAVNLTKEDAKQPSNNVFKMAPRVLSKSTSTTTN